VILCYKKAFGNTVIIDYIAGMECPTELKNYPGNKWIIHAYQTIINHIPPHTKEVFPFIGSGGVFCNKKRSGTTVINDLDTGVTDIWRKHAPATTDIRNCTAAEILAEVARDPTDTFVYMDPPYPVEFLFSKQKIYKHSMTMQEHINMLFGIRTVDYNCMISSYENEVYDEYLEGWNKVTFKCSYSGKVATEAIYFNYPVPEKLHQYNYLGSDCWDRQRIKRKISRRVKTLQALPAQERNAILTELGQLVQ